MKGCVVIGKTNVGKTLFALRFAAMLSLKEVAVTFRPSNGPDVRRSLPIEVGIATLTGDQPHLTRCIQSFELILPKGKGKQLLSLMDTCGLADGIHPEPEVRRAMAQTLAVVRNADVVLHMVDASKVGQDGVLTGLGPVDYQVAQFAGMRAGYAILANKMDLPGSEKGLRRLRSEFSGYFIFAISALKGEGLKEVKQFVWKHL